MGCYLNPDLGVKHQIQEPCLLDIVHSYFGPVVHGNVVRMFVFQTLVVHLCALMP